MKKFIQSYLTIGMLPILLLLLMTNCQEGEHHHENEDNHEGEHHHESSKEMDNDKPYVTHYLSENTKKMDLPFSDAVTVGNMVYLSGQLGNIPGSFKLVDGGIRAEAKQTMENIKTVLKANNLGMKDIVKCTVFIEDIKEWGVFNEEYVKFFPNKKPARSALGADGLALGARVEVECMACKRK